VGSRVGPLVGIVVVAGLVWVVVAVGVFVGRGVAELMTGAAGVDIDAWGLVLGAADGAPALATALGAAVAVAVTLSPRTFTMLPIPAKPATTTSPASMMPAVSR